MVTEKMYAAGMKYLSGRGTAWCVNDLYKVMHAQSDAGCQCPHCTVKHDSDCAVHNAPAYAVGECDCSAQPAISKATGA